MGTKGTDIASVGPLVQRLVSAISYRYHLIKGGYRVAFNSCPLCNSDAPELDDCPICLSYSNASGDEYPPSVKQKEAVDERLQGGHKDEARNIKHD